MQLALSYPCQEVSYNKLLGQLQDRGNAATSKGYLELLEKAFVIRLLHRYSARKISSRISSPKIVPMAPALIHAYNSPQRIGEGMAWTGLVFETTIANKFASLGFELYYWNKGRYHVDFVAGRNDTVIAVEVKFNDELDWRGLRAFNNEYPTPRPTLIAMDKHLGFEYLNSKEPMEWLKACREMGP